LDSLPLEIPQIVDRSECLSWRSSNGVIIPLQTPRICWSCVFQSSLNGIIITKHHETSLNIINHHKSPLNHH
jgi:hypothetical protein